MSDSTDKSLTLQELPELRRKTEAVSKFLMGQLTAHLETLRPLFAPERVLGKNAGGKLEVPGSERAMVELQQSYKPFTSKPYDLPASLDANWLTLVGSALELHPCDYVHQVQGKAVTMSSPVRWMVNFRANYTAAQVKNILAGREAARPEYLRQYVVNALVLQLVLARHPGLVQLFADLRYELKTERSDDLRGLPVVTVTSCLKSFRPADDLILAATAFSGVPAFIELIDVEALQTFQDGWRQQVEQLFR